jgi:hypothetical protein
LIGSIASRRKAALEQRLPSLLDALFEARVLVRAGVGLEAGAGLIVLANAKRVAHVVRRVHGSAVPRFQTCQTRLELFSPRRQKIRINVPFSPAHYRTDGIKGVGGVSKSPRCGNPRQSVLQGHGRRVNGAVAG